MGSWPRARSSAPMARNGYRSPGEPNVASMMRFVGRSRAMRGSVPDPGSAVIALRGGRPMGFALRRFPHSVESQHSCARMKMPRRRLAHTASGFQLQPGVASPVTNTHEVLTRDDRQRASALFKAYDVRGVVPNELTPALAREIGRALVATIQPDTIAVGRDMRVSSPQLAAALIEGIRDAGADVVDVDMVSTDGLSFAVGKYGYPAGVMVTASHNPPEYNGLKILRKEARALSLDEGLDEIRDRVVNGNLPPIKPAAERGRLTERDILDDYASHMLSLIDQNKLRPLRIAIDAGNGMAGVTVPRVFRDLPVQVTPMYFEPDGTFPNHPANPIEPENIAELRKVVVENGLDLGAAFDGDADRVFLVDEKGDAAGGDILTSMVADRMLERNPGAAIVYNLICSRGVPETITAKGGRPIRSRVGHSYIKETMRREDAVFGGEHSGHFYFRDNWYADSGMAALLFALEAVSEANQPLSAVIAPLDHRFRSGEINTTVSNAKAIMEEVVAAYAANGARIDLLDGITVEYPDRWFNLRASNTEPLLRLNAEADDRDTLKAFTDEVIKTYINPHAS